MIKLQAILNDNLHRWVKEKWTDQHGRPCGSSKTKGVKKCRPSKKVSKDTPKTWKSFDKKEKEALVAQKRRVGMGNRTAKAESVVDDRIKCDKCDHAWSIASGGNDLYVCHACGHDNTPIDMIDEKKKSKRDACYYKVKARYTKDGGTWPSAYGGLALAACRKVGAANWGKSKNEDIITMENRMIYITEDCWDGYQQRGMKDKNGRSVPNCVKVEVAEGYCSACLTDVILESYNTDTPEYVNIIDSNSINEAEYQGRKVKLGKPTRGDIKKFKVYVRNAEGNVVKVNFGHGGTSAKKAGQKTMRIRKSNPARRKSFRARHNCENPGPRWKARYWSCRKW